MKLNLLFNLAVFPFAVAALSVIGFPNQAKAAAFSGNVSGSWGKPTPGDVNTSPVYSGVEKNEFTWGHPIENAFANQLVFKGNSFSTDTGSLFKIGDLTYVNGTVHYRTSVESVPLKLSLSFNKPNKVEQVFDYQFNLKNTPNLSDDPELNADFLVVAENNAKRSFIHGGNTYTLSLSGFSGDNGKTNLSEFWVLEGEKTTAAIFGKISKVPFSKKQVPEPGFLLGLSVVGLCLISRRKA